MVQTKIFSENSDYRDDKELKEFIELFEKVKALGFIKSHRTHNTGIGKTLEDICEVPENNLSAPDFKNIEIKSQREYTTSNISLVTKSPDFPQNANRMLRETYGYPDENFPNIKTLRIRIGPKFNNVKNKWAFRSFVDDVILHQIVIYVKNLTTGELLEEPVFGWELETIRNATKKLERVAYIRAKKKEIDGEEYFHFTKFVLVTGMTFNKILDLIENGKIIIEPRLGLYNSGKMKGKKHDHGTVLRISKKDLINEFNGLEI